MNSMKVKLDPLDEKLAEVINNAAIVGAEKYLDLYENIIGTKIPCYQLNDQEAHSFAQLYMVLTKIKLDYQLLMEKLKRQNLNTPENGNDINKIDRFELAENINRLYACLGTEESPLKSFITFLSANISVDDLLKLHMLRPKML